jgi:hypothetical protein
MESFRIPAFSSPELQKAINDVRPVLEGADEARNRVSNDIKSLEQYLQDLGLKCSFRYTLGKGFVPENDQYVQHFLEESGSADGAVKEEALVWGPDCNGNSRLLYELSRWNGCLAIDIPGGPLFWDEATLSRDAKPLIETKFDIRKRMYNRLSDFVKALAAEFSIECELPVDSKTSQDDIPF